MEKSEIRSLQKKFEACINQYEEELSNDYSHCAMKYNGKESEACKEHARSLLYRLWFNNPCRAIEEEAQKVLSENCHKYDKIIDENLRNDFCKHESDATRAMHCKDLAKHMKEAIQKLNGCESFNDALDKLHKR